MYQTKTPWILRKCPARYLAKLERVVWVLGGLARVTVYLTGLWAIYSGPLVFYLLLPAAPLAWPVKWLLAHTDEDYFLLIYTLIQVPIVLIFAYGTFHWEYLREKLLSDTLESRDPDD